jgi:ferritin-like metal-binding protein YciE
MMGTMQSVATGPFKDEMVKNALMDFGAENFEIACYRALVTAAEQIDDSETARICQQIMRDEMDMARFLEQNLPMAVKEALMMRQREHPMQETRR